MLDKNRAQMEQRLSPFQPGPKSEDARSGNPMEARDDARVEFNTAEAHPSKSVRVGHKYRLSKCVNAVVDARAAQVRSMAKDLSGAPQFVRYFGPVLLDVVGRVGKLGRSLRSIR